MIARPRMCTGTPGNTGYTVLHQNVTLGAEGSGVDIVYAGGGNDFVNAGGGDDFIDGGSGADTIFGDAGDDTLFGDGGDDLHGELRCKVFPDRFVLRLVVQFDEGSGDDEALPTAGFWMRNGGARRKADSPRVPAL